MTRLSSISRFTERATLPLSTECGLRQVVTECSDMPPRKGQKNRFPLNEYLEIKRNQDALLVSALARDEEFTKKARKLKRLESKVNNIEYQILESPELARIHLQLLLREIKYKSEGS